MAFSKRKNFWITGGSLIAVGLILIFPIRRWMVEPAFHGKRVGQWFEEAVRSYQQSPNEFNSASFRAFREIEGDAVPLLVHWIEEQPSSLDQAYETILQRLPRRLTKLLPQPKDYGPRHATALELLKLIGMEQRFRSESGLATGKPSIAIAIPSIRARLRTDPATAASALWFIGPPAAPAVPDLIELAQLTDTGAATMAIQSFGLIGPAASNAVEVLTQIAASDRKDRLLAVQSLGGIGVAACSAAPVLSSLLSDPDEEIRIKAARSLGEIGVTPDEAVLPLLAMRQSTNEWMQIVASFALWNRNPSDEQLKAELGSAFQTQWKGALAFSLARRGTNAAPFLSNLKMLAEDLDPNFQRFAKVALRRIRSPGP